MKRLLFATALCISSFALATPQAARDIQAEYLSAGAEAFSAARGEDLWKQEFTSKKGDTRSCASCHGQDLTQASQHVRTKKVIDAMAASVNAERYIDTRKIHKWFKRNCKWTWGRECTPQEQGDILEYLLTQ